MTKDFAVNEKSPWDVDVDVYLYAEDHDPPFRIDSYLQAEPGKDLVFNNRRRPGFVVKFHIHDETGEGYLFPKTKDEDAALWSKMGEGCPPQDYGKQWDEFYVQRIFESRQTLVVRNLNKTATKFGYTLRVTKDDGKTFRDLDPGGDNQNGNWN
jgi:hypothetical protein